MISSITAVQCTTLFCISAILAPLRVLQNSYFRSYLTAHGAHYRILSDSKRTQLSDALCAHALSSIQTDTLLAAQHLCCHNPLGYYSTL